MLLMRLLFQTVLLGYTTQKHEDKQSRNENLKVAMRERKHMKVVLLGEDAIIGCQGGTGFQDG